MKRNLTLLSLVLSMAIIRCGGYTDEDSGEPKRPAEVPVSVGTPPEKPPSKPPEEKPPAAVPELSASIAALPEPNRYKVDLRWKHERTATVLYLQRNGGEEGILRIEGKDHPQKQYTDESVKPGVTYEYLMCVEEAGRTEVLDRKTITVPRDLVVSKYEDFDAGRGIPLNRIFFTEKAIITLQDHELKLYANELISNDAVLQSFYRGQKAEKCYHGKDASLIFLAVSQARGTLHVESRGEAGGEGNDGIAGQNGAAGAQGRPGEWAINPDFRKYSTSSPDWYVEHTRKYYLNNPDQFWWAQMLSGNQPAFVCKTPPTDGEPGQNGGTGGDGGEGGRGGNTARVHIKVEEASDLKVELLEEPGTGGIGGRGGKGGAGGAGGAPGPQDIGKRCPAAKQGVAGARGEDGRQGRPGDNGTKQPYCIEINAKTKGDCASFKVEAETEKSSDR